MQYIELKESLKSFTVFSLADIKSVDSNFHRRRLSEWQKKGYIKKVIKGYYVFSDLEINENVLFEIANRIYAPSYISLEMALSYHGLIPESVYGITSVSTRRTYSFKTPVAEFTYRTLRQKLFLGYELVEYGKKVFKIAGVEKALLDYFYLNPGIQNRDDFASLRINKEPLFEKANKEKLKNFLKAFEQKKLTKRIESFWGFMKNA